MRIVFMGTPQFAVPTLTAMVGAGHEIVAAYTRAPRPAGRGMAERPSPVELAAKRFGIEVLTPQNLRGEGERQVFLAHAADVAVVVAYGLILPKPILELPAFGCLNLHASLLPRWRGAAPIERAIMAGDEETGICVMHMEEGLDTGPVGLAERVAIGKDMTAGELHDVLAELGADAMVRALAALSRQALLFTPQSSEGVTYARKIRNDEARIDWHLPASAIHDLVRGLSPFPGAFFETDLGKSKERVKVLRARLAQGSGAPGTLLDEAATIACGSDALRLMTVQRAGRSPTSGEEFLRGARLAPGARLGSA
ncbi:MAG: methionyl-tRNA formyltransferase [Hyphomicrobiales bacterium]|nr:methionyl-tRNA formyltransferase [Hyphomicrobiales bacterium]